MILAKPSQKARVLRLFKRHKTLTTRDRFGFQPYPYKR